MDKQYEKEFGKVSDALSTMDKVADRYPPTSPLLKKGKNKPGPQDLLYAQEYLNTGNIVESFKKSPYYAGELKELPTKQLYKHAYKIFRSARVQKAIAVLASRERDKIDLNKASVITRMLKVYDRAMELDDLRSATSILDHLAKHVGMYGTAQVVVNNNTQINSVQQMDEKQVEERLQMLMRAASAEALPAPAKVIEAEYEKQ